MNSILFRIGAIQISRCEVEFRRYKFPKKWLVAHEIAFVFKIMNINKI
jgi:hypothetical protein